MKWTLRLINNAAFLLVIRGAVLQRLKGVEIAGGSVPLCVYTPTNLASSS